MLVLSRKAGEGITIGKDVVIDVLSIDGDRVRIGIKAPKDTRIFRRELLEETISMNREAASAPAVSFDEEKSII